MKRTKSRLALALVFFSVVFGLLCVNLAALAEPAQESPADVMAAHLDVVEDQATRLQSQIAHPAGRPQAKAELDELMQDLQLLQAFTVALEKTAGPALEERRAALLERLRRGEPASSASASAEDMNLGQVPLGSGTISGRVIATKTGLPIAGLTLRARLVAISPQYTATTDANGDYQLQSMPDGAYLVWTDDTSAGRPYFNETYDDVICDGNSRPCQAGATPVSILGGGAVGQIDFGLSEGGKLRGRVVDQDGLPIASIRVAAYSSLGVLARDTFTDVVGRFTIDRLQAGSYFLLATSPQHQDEVYPDLACEGGSCNILAGTPISVALNGQVAGLDFTLSRRATLRGKVVEQATGNPLSSIRITILDELGATQRLLFADSVGNWDAGDLEAGTYFAKASDASFETQLYDGIACPGTCPSLGTPLVLAEGGLIEGIDFSLSRLGGIQGTIRAAGSLELLGSYVEVYDSTGAAVSRSYYSTGSFSLSRIPAGNYFVRTDDSSGIYLNELWQDIPCFQLACSPATGTPVVVVLDQTTSGIDFVLEKLGRIEGQITDSVSAAPVAGATVRAYASAGGAIVKTVTSNQQGFYTLAGLTSGNYKVSAGQALYRSELWNDIPCTGTCDPSLGQNVAVALDQTTPGIDFGLVEIAHIAGTVRNEATNSPLPGMTVTLVDAAGTIVGTTTTDASGAYRLGGLADGNYFARAFSSTGAYFSEIYSGIDCITCPPSTTGTAIAVSVGNNRDDVDFTLREGGRIEGTVIQTSNGLPVGGGRIHIFDAGGIQVRNVTVDSATGTYSAFGLDTGTYYAQAWPPGRLLASEIWPNVVCPYASGCNPLLGTDLAVAQNTVTVANFSLDSMGKLEGRAVDAETGAPIFGGSFLIYDSGGIVRAESNSDAAGHFLFDGLGTDTYKVISSNNPNYVEQVFGGAYCEVVPCDLSSGTAVPVQIGQSSQLPDFALDFGPGLAGLVRRDGSPAEGVGLDLWLSTDSSYIGVVASNGSGRYRRILQAGSYYVTTFNNGPAYFDEVWNDVLCPNGPAFLGLCDPSSGQAVLVAPNAPATDGIDFDLGLRDPVLFGDGFESGDFGAWSLVFGD